jgi:predicted lipid-binding transport protein (Tim44 family)
VDEGEAISADLQAALQDGRDVLADARDSAEGLSTDDPAAFVSGAQDLAGSIQSGLAQVAGTFDELNERYDTPELEEAFEASDTCGELG